jgi:hypothetical protein
LAKLKELFWKETFKFWGKSQTVNSMFYGKGRFRNITYGWASRAYSRLLKYPQQHTACFHREQQLIPAHPKSGPDYIK